MDYSVRADLYVVADGDLAKQASARRNVDVVPDRRNSPPFARSGDADRYTLGHRTVESNDRGRRNGDATKMSNVKSGAYLSGSWQLNSPQYFDKRVLQQIDGIEDYSEQE